MGIDFINDSVTVDFLSNELAKRVLYISSQRQPSASPNSKAVNQALWSPLVSRGLPELSGFANPKSLVQDSLVSSGLL